MSIDQGGPKRHALGVDFGSSNTVAVACWPDGRARPILVDGSPLLPSAVYAEPAGDLIAGRDAVHSARLDPARYEPNPKRRVDDGQVLLGDREVPVVELIAAVLARVAEQWRRAAGPVPTDITLTCPATWGATRRGLLAAAATRAGLAGARLVAEPVAAATYFAEVLGRDVPIGSVVVVHDFGAGTFDASVVARTSEGFDVMAVDGRDDIGGLDVDAAIVEYLQAQHADAAWPRLTEPSTVAERRARRQLWDDVRVAKERLSRSQSADLVVPLLDLEIHLTRDELETLARPVLDQTVQVTRRLLRWADLPEGRLAGVFLVGGASRIPLVATLLHRELGEAPVVIEQPELVVAEGSVLAGAALLAADPAAPGPTADLRLAFARRAEPVPVASEAETVRVEPVHATPADNPGRAESAPARPTVRAGRAEPAVDPGPARPTVRAGRADTASAIPAVDPWPHAKPEHWEPDPDQTVADDPLRHPVSPAWGSPSAAPHTPAGPRTRPGGSGSRPGTPAIRPASTVRPPSVVRPASPATAATRPSPAARRDRQRATRPRSAAPGKPGTRPATTRPAGPRPGPTRRPGRFLRFLQVLLSIVVLIAVPLVALVIAYGYGTGQSFREAAIQLAGDLATLYRTHVAPAAR